MSKSDEQIERESTRKIRAEAKKALPQDSTRAGGAADWSGADPTKVFRLVCVVAHAGGATRLGYTRDGGAYSIGIYLGGDSKTYYCNEKEGIDEKLQWLTEQFED